MPASLLAPDDRLVERVSRQSRSLWQKIGSASLRLSLVLALSALTGGGWYLSRKGFSRKWREIVVEELHNRGVDASVRRLTLDPFRGLVAQDVRIYDYRDSENTLAVISEISLDLNYAAMLHHQPFLNGVDIRNAEITLPASPGERKPKPLLKHFRAHIYFPPEQIYVSLAEGIFCGIRVSATGQLIKRDAYEASPAPTREEQARREEQLRQVVAALGEFRFPAGPPQLQIKFSGDLSEMEKAFVEATLQSGQIARGNYDAKNVSAEVEWKNETLTIRQCGWEDAGGSLSARGTWSRATGDAAFQARSTLRVKPLLEAFGFGQMLADFSFTGEPVIEATGSWQATESSRHLNVIGRWAVEKFAYKSAQFDGLEAEFSWDGNRTMLRDIRLRHPTGVLTADLYDAPGDFRLNLDGSMNPMAFLPIVPAGLRPFLAEWEWQKAPTLRLAIRGQSHKAASLTGSGEFALGRTRFRGIWMNSANAKFQFGAGVLAVNDFQITRDEGGATGSVTYDHPRREVRLANVKASLIPADAIFWIEPKFWKEVVPYKFHHRPAVTASGVVQFGAGKDTRLQIDVDAPDGMDYAFLGKTLPFTRASGRLLFTDDRLQLLDLEASLFNGTARGEADLSLARNDHHYKASISAESVDFASLTDLYFKYKTSQGLLRGNYTFGGIGDQARTMIGHGKVEVTNGNVFAIPLLGPLSDLVTKVIPGAGYSLAHRATASFTIREGVIHTDDFTVAGKLFGMIGHGDLHFLDDKIDFDIRINAQGAPGVVFFPIYKFLEYKGDGSLAKPNWHAKRLPF